ncbi:MAG: hypothetical protein SGI87_10275 [Flavobacteriales bacterium]|nr:hypothetical protein [Flavobacteriales bacterium]
MIQSKEDGHLSKNEALHHIEELRKNKTPIHGIEISREISGIRETNMLKSTWYSTQRAVYKKARDFVMKQMNGEWHSVEIKTT